MPRYPLVSFLVAVAFLACGAENGSGGRLGAEGDSCVRTADCEAPLRCSQLVCTGSAVGSGDVLASLDSAAPQDETTVGASLDVSLPEEISEEESDDGGILQEEEVGEADLDVVQQVLADWLGADSEPEDIGPAPDLPQLADGNLNPFSECDGVGIQSAWSGTFAGAVSYQVPFPIPGAPSNGDIPVLGTLAFEVQCIEKKLIVVGDMDGLALDQFPFKLHLSGGFNPTTGALKAKMSDGSVALFDLGTSTVDVLFEGDFTGTLISPDAFEGTWDGYSVGTVPAGIPGSATGLGSWNAASE